MTVIEFPAWTPDLPPFGGGSASILNVLPGEGGYVPLPWPQAVGPFDLAERAMMLVLGRAADGITAPLVMTATAIWRGARTGWGRLNTEALAGAVTWNGAAWGDSLYLVNGTDELLRLNVASLRVDRIATPDRLGGRYIDVVGDHLVIAHTVKAGGGASDPYRLEFSGNRRPETFGFNPTIQAGGNTMADIGEVAGLAGGEYGLVIGTHGLARMDWIGGEDVFAFRTLEVEVGCDMPRSVIKSDTRAFWHSPRGWRMSQGGPSVAIGADKVDRWFEGRADMDRKDRMSAIVLPTRSVVMWSYVSRYSPNGSPDEVLCYHWGQDRWTHGKMAVEVLGQSASPSLFTDDPDLPVALGGTLTRRMTDDFAGVLTDGWGAANGFPAAIVGGGLHRLASSGVAAELETAELQLNPAGKAVLQRFRPIAQNAASVSGYVIARDRQDAQAAREIRDLAAEPGGSFARRVRARYHRLGLKVEPPFGVISGVDVTHVAAGGRR